MGNGTDLSVAPDLVGQQFASLNPLYPPVNTESAPPAPRGDYNTLTTGLPPAGTARPLTYYAQPPSSAEAAARPAQPPAQPPMMPIQDMTGQLGMGTKFGRFNTNPVGMVIHHTGGGRTVDQVINVYKQRGYPANFTIDRDGNIYQMLPNGYQGRHIINGTGLVGQGRSNANMEGVELIANNDADITPAQKAATANLVAQRGAMWGYNPVTSSFGHGEVNPPVIDPRTGALTKAHREPSEGWTITNGFRNGDIPVPDYTGMVKPVNITAAPGSAPAAPFANPADYPASYPVNPGQTQGRSVPGYVLSQDGKQWLRADTISEEQAHLNGIYAPGYGRPAAQPSAPAAQTYVAQPGGSPFAQMSNINLPSPAASLQLPPNLLTTPTQNMDPSQVPDYVPGGAY